MCSYLGDNGSKCAAGCLIADNEYNTEIEGKSWNHLIKLQFAPQNHSELITDLQSVHDRYGPIDWEAQLRKIAKQFNLEYNV